MTGTDAVYGLRMRRHMVGAVQSARDPQASVHCTNEAGRVRSRSPGCPSCHCLGYPFHHCLTVSQTETPSQGCIAIVEPHSIRTAIHRQDLCKGKRSTNSISLLHYCRAAEMGNSRMTEGPCQFLKH